MSFQSIRFGDTKFNIIKLFFNVAAFLIESTTRKSKHCINFLKPVLCIYFSNRKFIFLPILCSFLCLLSLNHQFFVTLFLKVLVFGVCSVNSL